MTEMECVKKKDHIPIGDSSASGKHYIPVPMWRPIVDNDEELEEEDQDSDGNKVIKEEDETVEESDEVEEIVIKETNERVKRKRKNIRESVRKTKKVKVGKQIKNPKDRWSAERYKSAEKSLWEVMKANGAVADRPIMRPALRVEARKKIGDTGLLDHLLKHMSGKVTPCGKDRFRRRHNPEGQMVFWLESSDLCSIRKQAGVDDPYWIPPPGWELGDSVTPDTIFAKELKPLKEEILTLKRYAKKKQLEHEEEVRKLRRDAKKKQLEHEEEVRKLKSEIKELKSKKRESPAIVVSSNPFENQELNQLANSFACAMLGLSKAPEQEKCKEQQIKIISNLVKELQEKLEKLQSKVEERSRSNSSLTVPTNSFYLKEKRQVGEVIQYRRGKKGQRIAAAEISKVKTDNHQGVKAEAPEEEKAKATFAPADGTDVSTNMISSASSSSTQQDLLEMEDLLPIATPPSVSLTPPRLPYQHQAPHLDMPLAELHRGFIVTDSSVSKHTTYEDTCITNTSMTPTIDMPHRFWGSGNEEENCLS